MTFFHQNIKYVWHLIPTKTHGFDHSQTSQSRARRGSRKRSARVKTCVATGRWVDARAWKGTPWGLPWKRNCHMSKLLVLQGAVLHFSELFSCQSSSSSLLQGMRWKWDFVLRKSYVTQSCSTTGCCAVLLPFPRPLPFHLGTSSSRKKVA